MRRTTVAVLAVSLSAFVIVSAAVARPATPRDTARQGQPAAAALDDPTIVAIFDEANTADIETGRLAAARGASREVRDFGAMLERDHTHVRQLGRDLAKKLGVTPTPPQPDQGARDHAAAMKQLRALHGQAFDRAFLQHEVDFHAAVIDAVQKTLLPAIQNPELKKLVTEVAPAFQAHMMAARNLQQKLAAAGEGARSGQ